METESSEETGNTQETFTPEETTTNTNETFTEENTSTQEITENEPKPEFTNSETTSVTEEQNTQPVETTSAVINQPITEIARQPIPKTITTPAYFKISSPNQSAYNESNPIPRNPEMPEGLIFKVQVGAFRNPIPQNHFKGFAPIMAEDAGNGITRYTAGLFTDFNAAIFARDEIRSIGYSDAFVVAFYNGKRISIPEARKIMEQQGGSLAQNNNTPTFANTQNTTSTPTGETTSAGSTSQPVELSVDENVPSIDNGNSVDVQNIKGVFYTVQVGVYSKPVTEGPLLTIKPLNSEKTTSGLIRYTSGRFTNLDDARAHKQKVNTLVPDAFITAYANGKRISVEEATKLLQQASTQNENINTTTENSNTTENTNNTNNTQEITTNTGNENNAIETENTTTENVGPQPKQPVDKMELIDKAENLNLEFKVLLGKYTEEVPIADAAKLLKLSGKGVKHFEYNDATYYTIGSYPDYQSALDKQIEMRTAGFENAQVIAMKNGKIIPTDEALKLIKE